MDTKTLVAEPVTDEIGVGEEGNLESTCRHCGGWVFMDDLRDADDGFDEETEEYRVDESCYWQHNDERYVPGQPSPCGPPERWAELAGA